MGDQNIFTDLIPGSHPSSENKFADLIPTDTETELPGFFEKFTDKKAYIGTSDIQEDYEDITEDLGSFDKFFFQTILGNEEVFRQKKGDGNFASNVKAFKDAVLSRDFSAILGALGGYAGVEKFFKSTAAKTFKKNPYIMTASVLAGAIGATGTEQIYDRVKEWITGDEETIAEIWEKIPNDFKRNLTYEMFGVGLATIPYYIKRGVMSGGRNIKQLFDSVKIFGGGARIAEIEKLLKSGNYKSFAEKQALQTELKTLRDKRIDIIPQDVAGPFAKMFMRIGGIFPFVGRSLKKFIEKRGENLSTKLNETLFALAPTGGTQGQLGKNIVKLAEKQYLNFRKIVGKQYDKFLDLASGIRNGKKIKGFDVNIAPLSKLNKDSPDYLLDVARKIIRDAQAGGKGELPRDLQTEAYKTALMLINNFGGKTHMDVRTLRNIITSNLKDAIKRSYSKENGASVKKLVEMKEAINKSFANLDLSKVSQEVADNILAQYKIANNMYQHGFKHEGKFFEGIDLYKRGMGESFEKIKSGIFKNKLTTEGKKYYAEWVKSVLKFGDKDQVLDLYKLTGKDNQAMGAFVRAFIDDAFSAAAKTRGTDSGPARESFNWLHFNPDDFMKQLGFLDLESSARGLTIGGKEEALTTILNTLNKATDGQVISGTNFRQLLNSFSRHGNVWVPDVGGFIKRAAVFGGIDTILGVTLAPFFGIGAAAGMAGGLRLGPTLAGMQFTKLLTNPQNVKYLFEALDSRIPYFKRYSAGIRLLELTQDSLMEAGADLKGKAEKDFSKLMTNFNKFYMEALDNMPDEGDKEPLKFQNWGETGGLLINPAARGDVVQPDETETVVDSEPDEIEEEVVEDVEINIPVPNRNFAMADVIPPLPNPQAQVGSEISGGVDPSIIARMESMGMPLFANEGGIASLMEHKKPQQMVA